MVLTLNGSLWNASISCAEETSFAVGPFASSKKSFWIPRIYMFLLVAHCLIAITYILSPIRAVFFSSTIFSGPLVLFVQLRAALLCSSIVSNIRSQFDANIWIAFPHPHECSPFILFWKHGVVLARSLNHWFPEWVNFVSYVCYLLYHAHNQNYKAFTARRSGTLCLSRSQSFTV